MAEVLSEDEDESDDETANAPAELDQADESTDYTETDLQSFRQQVEAELKSDTIKAAPVVTPKPTKYDAITSYIKSMSVGVDPVHTESATPDQSLTIDDLDHFEDALDISLRPPPQPSTQDNTDTASVTSGVSSTDLQEAADDLTDLDPNSREYRYKMVEKILSDARSQRSYSTNASTIAPSVIKEKIKRSIELKEQRDVRKRCLAKGEANATTRGRKENKETVKEYAGWDF